MGPAEGGATHLLDCVYCSIYSLTQAPKSHQISPSSDSYGPSTNSNLRSQPVEFSSVVERHLMSRLSSIIKSASDRGDQDSLRIGPIVNGNMGPPGQSQRSRPSTLWEEGARAEI